MVATAYSVALIDITTPGGVVIARWQSRWPQTVTWESQPWQFVRFEWDGVASGAAIGTAQSSIRVPLLSSALNTLTVAAEGLYRGRIRAYHYPAADNNPIAPPATMVFVGQMEGLVSVESITETLITASVSSGQAVVGLTFPPLRTSTDLIGNPCVLEV